MLLSHIGLLQIAALPLSCFRSTDIVEVCLTIMMMIRMMVTDVCHFYTEIVEC